MKQKKRSKNVSTLQESFTEQVNRLKALDVEIIRKDGTKGFNEILGNSYHGCRRQTDGISGYFPGRYRTICKRVEEIILSSEKRFKALYQESPIPTFTWQKKEGDDFFLADYNRAAIARSQKAK